MTNNKELSDKCIAEGASFQIDIYDRNDNKTSCCFPSRGDFQLKCPYKSEDVVVRLGIDVKYAGCTYQKTKRIDNAE